MCLWGHKKSAYIRSKNLMQALQGATFFFGTIPNHLHKYVNRKNQIYFGAGLCYNYLQQSYFMSGGFGL